MKSLFWILVVTLFLSCRVNPVNYRIESDHIVVVSGQHEINLTALTDDIIKVEIMKPQSVRNRDYAPVYDGSVMMDIDQEGAIVTAKTSTTTIKINTDASIIDFYNADGRLKLSEKSGFHTWSDSVSWDWELREGEAIYGAGSRAIPMNRRGTKLLCYNRPQYGYGWGEKNLNYSIPHMLSSEHYMLLIDNPSKATLDVGKTNKDVMEFKGLRGNQSYYFINGNDFAELIDHYTLLTGRQPLPPIWAMGYLQSRFGYRTQAEAEESLSRAMREGYPVDAIILDIYWFGPELEDGKMGQLMWDTIHWPDPRGMIERFHDLGVKVITVSEPFFTRKSQHYTYLDSMNYLALNEAGKTYDIADFYFGLGGLLDIFKPEAREWMWDQYQQMKSYGIDGWWVDLGEPEKHPAGMVHETGTADQLHGVYGHEWARMLYEGYQSDYPKERLFHMGRAGYAGTQRYGLLPWTGDVARNWDGMIAQPSMLLSMGLSGLGYMHADAGGFSVGVADSELYTRWMQFAAFTPIFRPHGDESIPSEPFLWPDEVQENIKPFVDLRYRLLPYNYTLAWENNQTGMPFMRPLFTVDKQIPDTIYNQYMWGDALLVAPVLKAGQQNMKVYFPRGEWYDFWTGRAIDKADSIALTEDHIPVFAKAGEAVMMSNSITNTSAYRGDDLICNYYYATEPSISKFYFDDGHSRDYLDDAYQLYEITTKPDKDILTIEITASGDGYTDQPEVRNCTYRVYGLDQSPSKVIEDGEVNYRWDERKKMLEWNGKLADDMVIEIIK